MKKLAIAAVLLAATAVTAPAYAAQTLVISGPSGTFGNDSVTCAGGGVTCAFSNTFTFVTPVGFNLSSATVSSVLTDSNMNTNIDFSSVTLNGTAFSVLSTGAVEFRDLLNFSLAPGAVNTLLLSGTVGGLGGNNPNQPANASYSGTLSFAAAAVPEPAMWLTMILGFGLVGGTLRRRQQKVSTTVKFA